MQNHQGILIANTNDTEQSIEELQTQEELLKNYPLLEHLELSNFKVQPCQNQNSHNHKQCQYYHGPKDRRRVGNYYSSDLCEHAEIDNGMTCPDGDKCPKAHNKVEQLYRPDKYKTKFCTLYPNNCQNCEYGSYCSFAHDEKDIMIELIHNLQFDDDFFIFYYKTVLCPFNYIQHDRGQCVYAHNWQDFRRKPQIYLYDSVPCQYWKPNDFIIKYEDGCPNKFNCTKCHGWKEYEYHQKIYKTKPCSIGQACTKGLACPYYHNNQDKRIINQNVSCKLFRYAPRNRILRNVFKENYGLFPQEIKFQKITHQFSSIIPETRKISQLNDRASTFQDFSNYTPQKKQDLDISPLLSERHQKKEVSDVKSQQSKKNKIFISTRQINLNSSEFQPFSTPSNKIKTESDQYNIRQNDPQLSFIYDQQTITENDIQKEEINQGDKLVDSVIKQVLYDDYQ